MNCKKCTSEWSINPALISPLSECPFCGEIINKDDIKKQIRPFENAKDVLLHIKNNYSLEIFNDKPRLLGVFESIVPHLKKEKKFINIAYEEEINKLIQEAHGMDTDTKTAAIRRSVNILEDEAGLSASNANMIVSWFTSLYEWDIPINIPAPKKKPESKPILRKPGDLIPYSTSLSVLENDPHVFQAPPTISEYEATGLEIEAPPLYEPTNEKEEAGKHKSLKNKKLKTFILYFLLVIAVGAGGFFSYFIKDRVVAATTSISRFVDNLRQDDSKINNSDFDDLPFEN